MILVKIHKKQDKTIIAVCDKDLLGKKFEDNNKQIDLTGDFYKGDIMDAIEVGDLIRNSDGINLVGEKAVALGLEEGVIDEKNILRVKGIPYAQALILQD